MGNIVDIKRLRRSYDPEQDADPMQRLAADMELGLARRDPSDILKVAYQPDFAGQAYRLMLVYGGSRKELAQYFGVTTPTLKVWEREHAEFAEAMQKGGAHADGKVAEALFKRATGFSVATEKVVKGEVHEIQTYFPPDTTAAVFWLKNRQPQWWRDKWELKHDFGDVMTLAGIRSSVERMSADELANLHRQLLSNEALVIDGEATEVVTDDAGEGWRRGVRDGDGVERYDEDVDDGGWAIEGHRRLSDDAAAAGDGVVASDEALDEWGDAVAAAVMVVLGRHGDHGLDRKALAKEIGSGTTPQVLQQVLAVMLGRGQVERGLFVHDGRRGRAMTRYRLPPLDL